MRLSIIIPVRDRYDLLERTLKSLHLQEDVAAGDYEIIVIADGQDQPEQLPFSSPGEQLQLTYRRIERAGPATARNRAVFLARTGLLVFLGADTEAHPQLLVRHLSFHDRTSGAACLGHIGLPDSVAVTNLDRFLYQGSQFHFPGHSQPVDFWHFYSSNISLSRSIFLDLGGFAEAFPGAGWEDSEFGYRFCEQHQIIYEPAAKVIHYHPVAFEAFLSRQVRLGADAHIFLDLHPELDRFFKVRHYPIHGLLKTFLASCFLTRFLLLIKPLFETLAYSSLVHYYFRIVRYQHFYHGYRQPR